jgi:hypothetical protein
LSPPPPLTATEQHIHTTLDSKIMAQKCLSAIFHVYF